MEKRRDEKMKNNAKRKIGTSLLMSAIVAGSAIIPLANPKAEEAPNLKYSAHVENIGWQDMVGIGKYAGTEGQALRLEAIKVQRENLNGVELTFDVHIENEGWKNNLKETDVIGSEGKAQRLEAIRVRSKGLIEKGYKLQYKVHVEDIGWTAWTNEGEMAGTEGQAKRVEAIEFRLVKTGDLKLEAAKQDALNQLKKEYKAEDYTIKVKEYEAAMSKGTKAINEAKSVSEVIQALSTTVTEFTNIPSDKQALLGLGTAKTSSVSNFIVTLGELSTKASSNTEIQSAILDSLDSGIELIETASSTDVVATRYQKALENAVIAAKDAAKAELDSLYKDGQKDGKDVKYLSSTDYQNAIKALDDAMKIEVTKKDSENNDVLDVEMTMKSRVESIVTAYTTADSKVALLSDIQKNAQTELTNLKTTVEKLEVYTKMTEIEKATINTAITAGTSAISDAKTRDEVSNAIEMANSAVLNAVKTKAQAELDKVYNGGKAVDYQLLSQSNYNKAKTAINNAKDVTAANKAFNDARPVDVAWKTSAEGAVAELEGYKTAQSVEANITSIVENAVKNIKQATSEVEMVTLKVNAIQAILSAEKSFYVKKIEDLKGSFNESDYFWAEECEPAIEAIKAADSIDDIHNTFSEFNDKYQNEN